MRKQDVKIGMKVVAHDKSVGIRRSRIGLENSKMWTKYGKVKGFLFVVAYDKSVSAWVLSNKSKSQNGDFFLSRDITPYQGDKK